MNIAILTVGYQRFAFKKISDATKALDLLSASMPVKWTDGGYAPEMREEDLRTISLEVIPATALKAEPKRVPESKRLGYTPTV